MTKLDILMTFLGIAAYVAIMIDLRNEEQKIANFEHYQEKRRVYLQNMNKKRVDERVRQQALERKAEIRKELAQSKIAGVAEELGSSDI